MQHFRSVTTDVISSSGKQKLSEQEEEIFEEEVECSETVLVKKKSVDEEEEGLNNMLMMDKSIVRFGDVSYPLVWFSQPNCVNQFFKNYPHKTLRPSDFLDLEFFEIASFKCFSKVKESPLFSLINLNKTVYPISTQLFFLNLKFMKNSDGSLSGSSLVKDSPDNVNKKIISKIVNIYIML